MSEIGVSSLDSPAYENPNSMLWFILIRDNRVSLPLLSAGVNEALWNGPYVPLVERKSRLMGAASRDAGLNITDVVCEPSFRCVAAAINFIEGFEGGVKNGWKALNIKIEGGLSELGENDYLRSQLRSYVVQRGHRIDETYKSSLKLQENCSGQRSAAFDDRLRNALDSIRKICLRSAERRVVVFADRDIEKELKLITADPPLQFGLFVIGGTKDALAAFPKQKWNMQIM
ncbi:hypothetical protein T05_8065 [Trichinella murrelli]|uniref:Uncharacterized protein n=1 Tax=Trichinella murrelli TaxID=144512 RepID=A0A0V0U5W8_9BILA|nr:hypothetical protein T05_8065 [Trichinella murrelli]